MTYWHRESKSWLLKELKVEAFLFIQCFYVKRNELVWQVVRVSLPFKSQWSRYKVESFHENLISLMADLREKLREGSISVFQNIEDSST